MKKLMTSLLLLITFSALAESKTFYSEEGPFIGKYYGNIDADSQVVTNLNKAIHDYAFSVLQRFFILCYSAVLVVPRLTWFYCAP